MRFWIIRVFLFTTVAAYSQTAEQDSAGYDAVYAWVERKMTYNYFDAVNQHWWVNRFQKNDNGSIVIKNIAAKHPDQVLEKSYHLRSFFLYDIDPRKISVIDLKESQGRFVKGRIVRLEGFGDEKMVVTSRDGIKGSNLNFVHISIPDFLEDSLQNYAFEVKEQLAKLVYLDARLFNKNDLKKNLKQAFLAFRGNYSSEDGAQLLSFETFSTGLVRFVWKAGEKTMTGEIGAQPDGMYFFRASDGGYVLSEMKFDRDERDLVLKDEGNILNVIGRNTLEFVIADQRTLFYRY